MSNKIPKILLLGNGINRAFGLDSWDKLLENMDKRKDKSISIKDMKCPESMKAIIVTEDNLDTSLKNNSRALYGTTKTDHMKMLQQLLDLDFDEILTTNYSYELEMASLCIDKLSDNQIKKMQSHTPAVSKCDQKYLLHTYNKVIYNNADKRIWHIHGEARKPNSMILGHYYYGGFLSKIFEYNNKRGNHYFRCQNLNREYHINSWIDAFIMGEIYILGFGFNMSEIDLWWLLNRKKREKAHHGGVHFYEIIDKPIETEEKLKYDLLKLLDVSVITIDKNNREWSDCYKDVIVQIKNTMEEEK